MNKTKNNFILILLFLFGTTSLFAQNDTVFNQENDKGQKIGYWKKTINDTLVYKGYFENGYPVGEMIRYYFDGEHIRAKLVYSNNGKDAEAIIFHFNGNIMSKGKYMNDRIAASKTISNEKPIKSKLGVKRQNSTELFPQKVIDNIITLKESTSKYSFKQIAEKLNRDFGTKYSMQQVKDKAKALRNKGWL